MDECRSRLDDITVRAYRLNMTIEDIKKVANSACRDFNVKRLDVFGSAARGNSATSSDVDLLVDFSRDPNNRTVLPNGSSVFCIDLRTPLGVTWTS